MIAEAYFTCSPGGFATARNAKLGTWRTAVPDVLDVWANTSKPAAGRVKTRRGGLPRLGNMVTRGGPGCYHEPTCRAAPGERPDLNRRAIARRPPLGRGRAMGGHRLREGWPGKACPLPSGGPQQRDRLTAKKRDLRVKRLDPWRRANARRRRRGRPCGKGSGANSCRSADVRSGGRDGR